MWTICALSSLRTVWVDTNWALSNLRTVGKSTSSVEVSVSTFVTLIDIMNRYLITYFIFYLFIYLTTIKHNYRLHQANISMKKNHSLREPSLKALTCKAMDSTSSCKSYYMYKCTELKRKKILLVFLSRFIPNMAHVWSKPYGHQHLYWN